jgi:hypothetical protein
MFNFFRRKARADLEDIVSAMAYANKTGDYYYHKPSEEVVLRVNPVFTGFTAMGAYVETDELAADIKANPGDYIHVPVLGLNENYRIMVGYTETLPEGEEKEHLARILKSSYPFRAFGRAVSALGLTSDYEKYRIDSIRDIALEWCRENGLRAR